MAIAITKRVLSGSTHGVGIAISQTQGITPIVVHTLSTSATTTVDEIYIYGNNNYSQSVDLVLEVGTSQSGIQIVTPIAPRQGAQLVVPGFILTGSACSISAWVGGLNGSASPAVSGSALVSIYGFVNRLVQT